MNEEYELILNIKIIIMRFFRIINDSIENNKYSPSFSK